MGEFARSRSSWRVWRPLRSRTAPPPRGATRRRRRRLPVVPGLDALVPRLPGQRDEDESQLGGARAGDHPFAPHSRSPAPRACTPFAATTGRCRSTRTPRWLASEHGFPFWLAIGTVGLGEGAAGSRAGRHRQTRRGLDGCERHGDGALVLPGAAGGDSCRVGNADESTAHRQGSSAPSAAALLARQLPGEGATSVSPGPRRIRRRPSSAIGGRWRSRGRSGRELPSSARRSASAACCRTATRIVRHVAFSPTPTPGSAKASTTDLQRARLLAELGGSPRG
jgi:hypothetical protein